MKRLVIASLLVALAARGQTNVPTGADLQRMKLELEVEKARLDKERAGFEAEKARWEAQRAAPTSVAAVVVLTNAPADPLFLARENVRLYNRGRIVGDLPAGSIVTATPHPKQSSWLIVAWRGATYEAEAKNFADTATVLSDLAQRAATAKTRYAAAQEQMDDLQQRRTELQQQITLLDLQRRQTIVVVPPPVTATNHSHQVRVFNDDANSFRSARLTSEQRDVERELDKLQKQLPLLAQDQSRAAAALQKAQQQIDAVRTPR